MYKLVRIWWWNPLLSAMVLLASASITFAQAKPKPAEPKDHSLTTKDGVELKITYYPSSVGKQAVPVILIPDWKESRSVLDSLAKRLQRPEAGRDKHKSFAVVTVDLRGHGDSTRQTWNGQRRDLDAAKLTRDDMVGMVQGDMEAVRRFLDEENNAGRLNINSLSIVGAGLGATVALNWAALDWSQPPLAVGQQGQFVKGLVLVSPAWKFKGVTIQNALKQPGVSESISFLILYGEHERQAKADAARIEKQLERNHPKPSNPKPDETHSLMVLGGPTGLQGTKLLKEAGKPAEDRIIHFLTDQVVAEEYPWVERVRP